MSIPESPEPEVTADPIVLREEPRIAPPRRSAGSPDSTAVWLVALLLGASAGAYALMRAARHEPAPAAPPPVVQTTEPARPVRPRPAPRVAKAAAPRFAPKAAPAASEAPRPAVVTHVEAEKKFVDPIEGFDSGEAFDNPTSPGRYGQRTSGLLERGTPAPRPTAPDPSFGRNPR